MMVSRSTFFICVTLYTQVVVSSQPISYLTHMPRELVVTIATCSDKKAFCAFSVTSKKIRNDLRDFPSAVFKKWYVASLYPKMKKAPLIHAVRQKNMLAVAILIKCQSIDMNQVGLCKTPPLSWAVQLKCKEIVQLLLKHKDIQVNKVDFFGRTPLRWATYLGFSEIVRLLLNCANVDMNKVDDEDTPPITWAAFFGYTKIVELLIRKGAKLDIKDDYNMTALCWAKKNGYYDIVKMLQEAGAKK